MVRHKGNELESEKFPRIRSNQNSEPKKHRWTGLEEKVGRGRDIPEHNALELIATGSLKRTEYLDTVGLTDGKKNQE